MTSALAAQKEHRVWFSTGAWFVVTAGLLFWLADHKVWDECTSIPYLGAALVLSGLFPSFRRRSRLLQRLPESPIPYVPIIGVVYGIYFGVPALLFDQEAGLASDVTPQAIEKALRLALLGWVSLMFAFEVSGKIRSHLGSFKLPVDPARGRRAALGFIATGIVVDIIWGRRGSGGQCVQLLKWLPELGLGLLMILRLRGELPGAWRVGGGAALMFFLFLRVGDGSIAQLLLPIAFFVMLTWGMSRRVPYALLGGVAVVAMIMRGNVDAFRDEAWRGDGVDASKSERSNRFIEMLSEQAEQEGFLSDSMMHVLARVNHLVLFGLVIDKTPGEVPYWGGETYSTLGYAFVPRLIWPNKPKKNLGQEFGHRYRILAPSDDSTSINLPQLVEFYANYGEAGVAYGMALMGLLFRLFYNLFNRRGMTDGTVIVGAAIFSRLLNVESDLSLVFGAVPFQIAFLYSVVSLARPRPRSASVPVFGQPHSMSRQGREVPSISI